MTDRRLEEEGQEPEVEEYEVETEESEALDVAMRDALEAVERRKDPDHDPTAEAGASAPVEGADLETRLAELSERHLRTLADFENYRKRTERERVLNRRYEGLGVIAELLPILDNLGLALEAEGSVDDLKAGVELIAKQFHELLRSNGVERIESEGKPFDPSLHHAVSRDEDPEVEVATVAEELRPGYRMGDRLVRPASVRVSVPVEAVPPSAAAPTPDPESLS